MQWVDILTKTAPIIVVTIAYFVHLEVRLTKIQADLKWIKRQLETCQRD